MLSTKNSSLKLAAVAALGTAIVAPYLQSKISSWYVEDRTRSGWKALQQLVIDSEMIFRVPVEQSAESAFVQSASWEKDAKSDVWIGACYVQPTGDIPQVIFDLNIPRAEFRLVHNARLNVSATLNGQRIAIGRGFWSYYESDHVEVAFAVPEYKSGDVLEIMVWGLEGQI